MGMIYTLYGCSTRRQNRSKTRTSLDYVEQAWWGSSPTKLVAWLAKNPGGFGQHNPAMCAFLSDSGGAYCTSIVCRSAPCIPFWLRTTFTFWDTGWPTPATQHPYGVDTKLKLKTRTRISTRASVRAASCCQRAQQLATNCALEPARGSLDARQGHG